MAANVLDELLGSREQGAMVIRGKGQVMIFLLKQNNRIRQNRFLGRIFNTFLLVGSVLAGRSAVLHLCPAYNIAATEHIEVISNTQISFLMFIVC